jgi:hypothetical protein
MESNLAQPSQRSRFVTAAGWFFLIIFGLSALLNLSSMVMMITHGQFRMMVMPFVSILFQAVFVAASIGLIKRRNWARLFFIVVLSVVIAIALVSALPSFFKDTFPPVDSGREHEQLTMRTLTLAVQLLLLIFSALAGFLVKELFSPPVKKEFSKITDALPQ